MNSAVRAASTGAILFGLLTASLPAAAADTLTVTTSGGSYGASQRAAYFDPFTRETGITVLVDEWRGDIARIRAMVETRSYVSHVIDVETDHVIAGCAEGLLERIDYQALGFARDDVMDGAAHECAVGSVSWSTVLVYDAEQVGDRAPDGWADFWDVESIPGKRGLYRSPKFNIEFALIADGVPPDRVNAVLNADPDAAIERAFAKLDQLKPHVVWWESGAQSAQLLASRQVVMSSMWNGRAYTAIVGDGKPFRIVWKGQGLDFSWWTIPRGHPGSELAHRFIAFASEPERQGVQANLISYAPLRKGAYKYVNAEMLAHLPTAPQNQGSMFISDGKWWSERREVLTERFSLWLTK